MFDYQRVSIKNGTRQKNWRNECQQERRGFQQQNLGFPAAQKEMKLLESWINDGLPRQRRWRYKHQTPLFRYPKRLVNTA